MRLLSLHLRNYRLHKELSLDFDPARNLIGGPKESGKSTLAEAIHRALFLRAKTGGALREEMRSSRHQGDPEVTLVFEAAGTRWTLEKRFAGSTKGSTLLTDAGGTAHKDDEADIKLADLHQCDTGGGRVNANANQLSGFWSHLWVWQGSAGSDPARQAGENKDTLVQRLQEEGLASVIQSSADLRARERINEAYSELFTPTGKAKAGSKPETARIELEKAASALGRALEAATLHQFQKSGRLIRERVMECVEARFHLKPDPLGGCFVWPDPESPDQWLFYRVPIEDEHLRKLEDISFEELRAASRAAAGEDIPFEIARLFGIRRLSAANRERLETMLALRGA